MIDFEFTCPRCGERGIAKADPLALLAAHGGVLLMTCEHCEQESHAVVTMEVPSAADEPSPNPRHGDDGQQAGE